MNSHGNGNPLASRPHIAQNSGNNEWYTPSAYIEAARRTMGSIDCDPASSEIANRTVRATTFYTAADDGLAKVWEGNVWLNPPYAQPLMSAFAEHLVYRFEQGEIRQACVLVNNATETEWFQRMLRRASALCFPKTRIKFLDTDGNPNGSPLQGQAVLYFGSRWFEFCAEFGPFGYVASGSRPSHSHPLGPHPSL